MPLPGIQIDRENANAYGVLQADAPLLAEKLLSLTGYSHMVLGLLRAVDLYRQMYGVQHVRIDTWTDRDELRHRLTSERTGAALSPPQIVGPQFLLARTYRMMDVLRTPGMLAEVLRVVEVLDAYVAQKRVTPRHVEMETGYPKFIRGMTYVVSRISIM